MTAQFPDNFIYKRKRYDLVAYSAGEPFNPRSLGFEPFGACSACWRGYVSDYALGAEDTLILKNLSLSLPDPQDGGGTERDIVPINGVIPSLREEGDSGLFNTRYENVGLPIVYTGGILIADGFIQELYVHMGFHPAWKYKRVHELIFEAGKLQAAHDRTLEMKALRKALKKKKLSPGTEARDPDIVAWIEKTFDRSYS